MKRVSGRRVVCDVSARPGNAANEGESERNSANL